MKKFVIIGFSLFCFIIFILLFSMFNIATNNPIENHIVDSQLNRYYFDNDNDEEFEKIIISLVNESYPLLNYYLLSPEEIAIKFEQTYDSHNLSNPCQFYSYFWKQYFDYHNYETEYVLITGHIFVVARKDTHYYVADQFKLIRTDFN